MKNTRPTPKYPLLLSTALLAFLTTQTVAQTTVFDSGISSNTVTQAPSAVGWTVTGSDAVDYSGSTDEPVLLASFSRYIVGDRTDSDVAYATTFNHASFDTANYESDLAINIQGFISDQAIDNSPPLGTRVLVEMGGIWYGSDLYGAGGYSDSLLLSDAIWRPWTQTPTGSFTYADVDDADFGTSIVLSGVITNTGTLVVDVQSGEPRDNVDLRVYNITGTAIVPEPSSFALVAGLLGLTSVMLRRRG